MGQQKELYHVGTLTYTRQQLAKVLVWLVWGDICYTLMETVVPTILPLKFQRLGATNTEIAVILTTIPMLINSVFNPIISFKSDRYRSKWGRRIPFILFTLPFLVICLVGVGYADRVGFWVHSHYPTLGHLTPNSFAVLSIAVFMVAFSFLNTFVNSVFWYLFNDVVPEHLLARFMSWFRSVSMASSSIYNFFIFKYAGAHSTEIIVGAGMLYFAGFGMMCLKVKEGQYPPPPAYVERAVRAFFGHQDICQGVSRSSALLVSVSNLSFRSDGRKRRRVHAILPRIHRFGPGSDWHYKRVFQHCNNAPHSVFRVAG